MRLAFRSRRRRCAAAVLALLLGVALAAPATAGNPPYPRDPVETLFPEPPRPVEKTYAVGERTIHYWEMAGGPARIVFIHGTPGDWKAWAAYLREPRLRARATLVALDRPGFGASDPGRVEPSLAAQAKLIAPLLRAAAPAQPPEPQAAQPVLVVGHSLGGPIAAELLLDYPGEVGGAVLVAPSIDPETETPRWYNRVMAWPLARWLLPAEFDWANREILPLQAELQTLDRRWAALQAPVTLVQGGRDELVDPRTADYAERALPARWTRVLRVPDQGHFVLWKQPGLVVDAILATLDRMAAAAPGGAR